MAGLRALRFDLQGLITVQHRDPGGEQNGFVSQFCLFQDPGCTSTNVCLTDEVPSTEWLTPWQLGSSSHHLNRSWATKKGLDASPRVGPIIPSSADLSLSLRALYKCS
jgi:hypothetical protein